MSRSYKKPILTDGQSKPKRRKSARTQANQCVRQAEDVANHGAYKRISNSYDICDWKAMWVKDPKAKRK